jgi:hypothetical protein
VKLPDFLLDPDLDRLRQKMGHIPLGHFVAVPGQALLSSADLANLSGEGIEVAPDEVEVLGDSTLSYRGRRVILYIRESHMPPRADTPFRASETLEKEPCRGEEENLPRFHVAHCRTLEIMRISGRRQRYVVATRDDGIFDLLLVGRPIRSRLRVCKNCLEKLDWKGFCAKRSPEERNREAQDFRIDAFFRSFGRTVTP